MGEGEACCACPLAFFLNWGPCKNGVFYGNILGRGIMVGM